MDQSNGKHSGVSVIDLIEDDPQADQTTGTFYAANNPALQPAKPLDTRKKSWKRKLIGWSFVLLLIGGGAVALYLLLRINRVNVKVQAESRPESGSTKPKTDGNNPENGLTAEAINIAREATGADTSALSSAIPSASPNASPAPSPANTVGRNLSFTANSPVFAPLSDPNSTNGNSNSLPNNATAPQQSKTETGSTAEPQSHANVTQSLFVDDLPVKLPTGPVGATPTQARAEKNTTPIEKSRTPPPVLPPFGTMLPVRTQGVIFSLRNNSYARLEVTRDTAGEGWSLRKGTVLVGRTSGSEYDRAFVNVIGYIDPRDNKLVKMSGDVLGGDGAAGLPGKRIRVDRNRLKQTLRKVASSGIQVAGMMAGALTGRGTVVLDGTGYRVLNPITDEARGTIGGSDEKNTFVKVQAGQAAYVMVADLPKSIQAVDAPGEDELLRAAGSLSDREVMELILFGTPEEIRAAAPLMTDEQKRLTLKTFPTEDKR